MWLYEKPIAHRGLHNETLTENSMGAYRNALENGYNIEIDVHLLKSGEIAVFHDYSLSRVCGKDVKITDLTLADLQGDNYLLPSGEHIPLLTELLEMVDGKTGILLEIKFAGFSYKLEQAVLDIIKGKESYIAVQCFSPYTMRWFRNNAPEFCQGLLSTNFLFQITSPMLKSVKPDFIAYDVNSITPYFKKKVAKNNYAVLLWTVRNEKNIETAINIKANNIIFEHVDLEKVGFKITDLQN
jgi:glycerophosphoryl diester phosphodiesterase